MNRPENKYQKERDERQKMGGTWFTDLRIDAFEEGVDAGREWGHEEEKEEWRDNIRRALRNHTEQFVYGHEKIIPVEHIEALL